MVIKLIFRIFAPNGTLMKNNKFILVCGAHKKEIPVIGKIFKNYTVISTNIATTKDRKSYWLVKCKCGNEKFIRADILKSNQVGQCKVCSNKEKYLNNIKLNKMHSKDFSPSHQGIGDLSKMLFNHYKYSAKRRNIVFDISLDYAWNIFNKQNNKCALSGKKIILRPEDKTIPITNIKNGNRNINYNIFNASLDRIDSSKGYIEGNIQWLDKKVNIMKNILNNKEFIQFCNNVVKHVNQQPS